MMTMNREKQGGMKRGKKEVEYEMKRGGGRR